MNKFIKKTMELHYVGTLYGIRQERTAFKKSLHLNEIEYSDNCRCVVGVFSIGSICLRSALSYSLDIAVGVATPAGGVLLLDSVNYPSFTVVVNVMKLLSRYISFENN